MIEETTTHIVKELDREQFTHKNAIRAFRMWNVHHYETGGHISDEITVHLFSDGLTISQNDGDGDGFIILYGKEMKTFLKIINGFDFNV